MSDGKRWKPDTDEALKALIRQTIKEMGETDPAAIPHLVKRKLKSQAAGDLDIEAYVREVLRDLRGK